jgi:DNA recombination protein RmuC
MGLVFQLLIAATIGLGVGALLTGELLKSRSAVSAERNRSTEHQLADANARIEVLQSEVAVKSAAVLDVSTKCAGVVSERDGLKTVEERGVQIESQLREKTERLGSLSAELAGVTAERDALNDLVARDREIIEELGKQARELPTMASQLAVATTERDSIELQLEDASGEIELQKGELRDVRLRIEQLVQELAEGKAALENERSAAAEKLVLLQSAEARLASAFDSLAVKALRESNAEFLRLASNQLEQQQKLASGDVESKKDAIAALLQTASSSLQQLEEQIRSIDTERQKSHVSLEQQIVSLVDLQHRLSDETRRLSKALEKPTVRGNWGEVQLRRVVEFAGMIEHCDFDEQTTVEDDEGNRRRPDLTVNLPNGRVIAVDAKVSVDAFIKAASADSPVVIQELMNRHADQIRKHVNDLSSKTYWSQFPNSPDFVIAFVPSEALLSAALQTDPTLLDDAAESRVLLASPLTLIALLKAVNCGWREDKLARNAGEISELGRVLYKRLVTLGGHISSLGDSLGTAVDHYNSLVGSIERSAFPAARKFEQLGAAVGAELGQLGPIEKTTRALQSPDWKTSTTDGVELVGESELEKV